VVPQVVHQELLGELDQVVTAVPLRGDALLHDPLQDGQQLSLGRAGTSPAATHGDTGRAGAQAAPYLAEVELVEEHQVLLWVQLGIQPVDLGHHPRHPLIRKEELGEQAGVGALRGEQRGDGGSTPRLQVLGQGDPRSPVSVARRGGGSRWGPRTPARAGLWDPHGSSGSAELCQAQAGRQAATGRAPPVPQFPQGQSRMNKLGRIPAAWARSRARL